MKQDVYMFTQETTSIESDGASGFFTVSHWQETNQPSSISFHFQKPRIANASHKWVQNLIIFTYSLQTMSEKSPGNALKVGLDIAIRLSLCPSHLHLSTPFLMSLLLCISWLFFLYIVTISAWRIFFVWHLNLTSKSPVALFHCTAIWLMFAIEFCDITGALVYLLLFLKFFICHILNRLLSG